MRIRSHSCWPGDIGVRAIAGLFSRRCGDWLNCEHLVVSSENVHTLFKICTCVGDLNIIPAKPRIGGCEGEGCRQKG